MDALTEPGAELHRRRWTLLALTSVGAFMTPLDGSIVAVALPRMGPLLHLSFAASLWVQAAYLLTIAVLLIPLGRLADQRGRVPFYLGGLAVFTLGSLAAALSRDGTALILARVLQGGGGALLFATSSAIVTAVFPPEERGRALGINVMAVYVGLSVGPPLGGFLVDRLGWPWIFLVNLPIGTAALLWGWRVLPRGPGRTPRASERLDFAGATLLGLALAALLTPLTFAAQWGWRTGHTWGLLALSAVGLGAFLARERRTAAALVDLRLLRRNRLFAAANLAALLNHMSLYAITILTAVELQLVQGRSARAAGWIMLGQPITQAVLSPLAGHLSDRLGSRLLSTMGMLLTAFGMALLAALGRRPEVAPIVGALALVGVGLAAFSAPNTSAIMGSVEHDQLSMASAFLSTMRVLGQALSVAILGGITASHLGPGGWRALLQAGGSPEASAAFAQGYSAAMATGAGLALLAA